MKTITKISILSCMVLLLCNCVEPVELESITTETLLVVEANLTNEDKRQEVLLSRTTALEETTINRESSALVRIIDETGTTYRFTEDSPGVYLSDLTFSAEMNRDYKLELETKSGDRYSSTWQRFTGTSEITDIYAERTTNENNEEGISIFIDSETTDETGFYRYEYEETFKIIPPKWYSREADIISREPSNPIVGLKAKEKEDRVCYRQEDSKNIILSSTDNISVNELIGSPVRFLKRNNYLIQHRYSILVKQYSQNIASFEFYTILRDLSSSANFFTELQPGFITGNLSSEDNKDEKVVGFFNVSSVSEKRFFFNYKDVFLDEEVVIFDFPSPCNAFSPPLQGTRPNQPSPLISSLENGFMISFETKDLDVIPVDFEGPYTLVPRICGDCTVLGSNIVPDFWIE